MLFRFGPFELDLARMELREGGAPRPLEPQVFGLLAYLVENRERMVSRDELVEKIWDGRVVSDAAISSRIKSARHAIGDDGRTQRYIRTLHGRGFRFVADAERVHRIDAPAEPTATVGSSPGIAQADHTLSRPSVAVLSFQWLGEAGPYATIAEALPHELIAELSRLRWLFVTARESSFRLGSAQQDPGTIGRLLGVTYLLTGTIEMRARRLGVTVRLVDTRGGEVVWADRFDGALADVHEIRSTIRTRVLGALELEIPLREARIARLTVTENLDAWAAYHLGLQHMFRFNRRDNAAALALFERSVTQDPSFARAHAGLSFVHFQTAFLRHSDDVAAAAALARRCAEQAVDLDPHDPFVNFTMGRSFWLLGDLDASLPWLDRAITLNPNYAQGIYARAWTEALAGHGHDGREHADLAMRLSPLDPLYYAMLGTRAFSELSLGDVQAAAVWAERAARSPGAHVLIAMIASMIQTIAGHVDLARYWANDVRARSPQLTSADFFRSFPLQSEPTRSRVAAALKKQGF